MQRSESKGPQPDGSVICLSCGLCCNGFLSFWGQISVEEVLQAQACGLDVVDAKTVRGFKIPCPQFQKQRCAVYHESGRPQTCRGYRCWVLQRYIDGRLTQENVQQIIHMATTLIAKVTARIELKRATGLIRLAKALSKTNGDRISGMSQDDWHQFESYLVDLQEGAHDESGKVGTELLGDIFRAGGFLRLQFVRQD